MSKGKLRQKLDEYESDDLNFAKKTNVLHDATSSIHTKSSSLRRRGDAK
jgi:hypothetical protein